MEWLSKIDKEKLAVLQRKVSLEEVAAYRRQTGLSRRALGFEAEAGGVMAIFVITWLLLSASLTAGVLFGRHLPARTTPFAVAGIMIAIVLIRSSRRAIRRHVRLHDFASQCGLSYDPVGQNGAVGTGLLFDVGHTRKYRGVLYHEEQGRRLLEIGRYQYTVGGGKHKQTYTWRYLAVRLPRKVPHIILDSKDNNVKLMGRAVFSNLPVAIPKNQRIKLEGDFNKYFTLYAPKKYDVDVRYILTPDVMAALVDASSTFDVELVDDMAFFYTLHGGAEDAQVLDDMIAVLKVVGRELHDQKDGYADDRVTNARQRNIVGQHGQRLRF